MEKTLQSKGQIALVKLIREEREEAGLTQEEVARAFGKRQDWMAHLESAQRRIDVVEDVKLASLIGFDAADELGNLIPIILDE